MNIQFIKYFVVLAETQNFTKAAEKMYVVQSTFSAGIKKLEEHLDCQLFYRDKRNVRLTSEGFTLLPKAKKLLSLWGAIESEFLHSEDRVLRIGVISPLIPDAYVPQLKSFQDIFGQFKVHITEDKKAQLYEKLSKGDIDCIFIEDEKVDEKLYDKRLVYEEVLDIAVPVSHPLAIKDKLELKALDKMPFIERCNCALFNEVQEAFTAKEIDVTPVFTAHSNDTVSALVNSGVGISLMSKPNKAIDGVKFISISDASFKRKIIFVWRRDNDSVALSNFLSV
ncbi:LysR family transcriptional regulator [Carboxylicivirga sp. RSCT41]|uniref:LysR family transcriptional regulator n=1 Tax=Carboxylicivirga agarovorans TaxID=3417570 RepID=UPI003D341016